MDITDIINLGFWGIFFFAIIVELFKSIRLVPTKKAFIVERLGRYHKTLDAGFHVLFPFFDKVTAIQNLKERTIDVPPQDCFSMDEVNVEVDGVIYLQVIDPAKASYGVTHFAFAAVELAQTTTRSFIGTLDLDRTFEERDLISSKVVQVLNEAGESWGIRVHRYEIKNITPPNSVQNAMEKQVNAERERRAILAKSEGDKQSRINMSEGRKIEMINVSEGEMKRRITEAEGRADEITTMAKASAESIRKIAEAITVEGGEKAFNLKLTERYISKMKALSRKDVEIIIPGEVNNFKKWTDSLALNID